MEVAGIIICFAFVLLLHWLVNAMDRADDKQKAIRKASSKPSEAQNVRITTATPAEPIQKKADIEKRYVASKADVIEAEPESPAIYESDTPYCERLTTWFDEHPQQCSFENIRSLSTSQNNSVFNELNRGLKQIDTPQQLEQYMFSYGNMHNAKLIDSFSAFINRNQLDLCGKSVEVFDYGCGQGLATIALIDYLKSIKNADCHQMKVTLIEPSELALKRAALHVQFSLRSASLKGRIRTLCYDLNDIKYNQLSNGESSIKFHLFSNILDVTAIDVSELGSHIAASLTGINYFVCVSPNFNKSGSRDFRNQRIHNFYNFFKINYKAILVAERETDIAGNGAKNWERFERVFSVTVPKPTPLPFIELEPGHDLPF